MNHQATALASTAVHQDASGKTHCTKPKASSTQTSAQTRLTQVIWSAKGLDLEAVASPTCGNNRMSSSGNAREHTCPKNSAAQAKATSKSATTTIKATLLISTNTSASTPKAPTRESFMMLKICSRDVPPPMPSAQSLRPSS